MSGELVGIVTVGGDADGMCSLMVESLLAESAPP
jgi:hypothetical protein